MDREGRCRRDNREREKAGYVIVYRPPSPPRATPPPLSVSFPLGCFPSTIIAIALENHFSPHFPPRFFRVFLPSRTRSSLWRLYSQEVCSCSSAPNVPPSDGGISFPSCHLWWKLYGKWRYSFLREGKIAPLEEPRGGSRGDAKSACNESKGNIATEDGEGRLCVLYSTEMSDDEFSPKGPFRVN